MFVVALYNAWHCWMCKQTTFYQLICDWIVTIMMNVVIWTPEFHTFLVTLYNTKHCWISTQTTFYRLISNFSMTIRMNMVIWTPGFHQCLTISVTDYISNVIIQHRILQQLYKNYMLSIRPRLQCGNSNKYGNMNSWVLYISSGIIQHKKLRNLYTNHILLI